MIKTTIVRIHLYVFEAKEKFLIAPQKEEGFVEAIWFKFEEAKEKITFDLDNLLAARQIFYEKRAEKRLKKKDNLKSLSICLPTHNGEQTISRTLKSIKGSIDNIDQDIKTNILICLDHCTDSTEEELRKFKKNLNINIVKNEGQKGKAEALNLLFERSPKDSDAFVFIDDDVELDKNCLNLMIKELNKGSNQFVFAEWKRKVYIKRNAYRKFWYKVFGVKFDIQIYRKKSQLMRGACMMCQREDFVRLPGHIINDDQFFQYIYWPNTKEVAGAVTYFDSVDNCRDYRNRFLRIGQGMRQLDNEFAKERLEKCKSDLFLSVDKDKIKRLDFKTKILFKIYRVIRYFVKIWVDIKLRNGKDHGWYRTRKN